MPALFWLDISILILAGILTSSLVVIALGFGYHEAINRYFAVFAFLLVVNTTFALGTRLELWAHLGDPLLALELAIPAYALAGPVLLMLTVRYLNRPSPWADRVAIGGILLILLLTIPLFQGKLIGNPRLSPNGTLLANTTPWGALVAVVPCISLVWSIILFWQERHRTREPYMAACALFLLAGIILGGILQVSFPVGSFANTLSIIVLAYGVLSRQLFNPLKKRTVELQNQIAERINAEATLQQLNIELEQRVAERTRELQDINENLVTVSRVKDEFVTNISHELRTPITSIMLYHSILESRPETISTNMQHLKHETSRLARLIEDLLTISRLDHQDTGIKTQPVDLNRLAEEYVHDRTPLAEKQNLSISLETAADLPVVQVDENMIGQVLSILLTNAFAYTPPGGMVAVCTQRRQKGDDQTWAVITVGDTGPGIPPEEQTRIFERFYRGKAGRESKTAGTGLGLAIAKTIIERHEGWIEVQSEGVPGKGATFEIWLPVSAS